MREASLKLLPHQHNFVSDIEHRFLGLVAGYGSGKTYSFCAKGIYMASINPGHTGALLEPTNAMAADVLVPAFQQMLIELEIPHSFKATPYPTFQLFFTDDDEEVVTSTVLIRSAENYRRLAGLNLAWFGVDECDTINKNIAWQMWRLLQSRLRAPAPHIQGFTTSTPEGFNFLYEYFVKEVEERRREGKDTGDRRIIHASTYDNEKFLEPGFIQSLLESYPPNLIEGYLNGKFTNLNTGTVYIGFNRKLNNTDLTMEDFDDRERGIIAPLHIGVDFNIEKTCGIVHVLDEDGMPLALDEIVKQRDTEALIKTILKRYPDRHITIYPDASGDNRKTNAATTDIRLLKAAGFRVKANNKNPPVRDRVNSMNAMFCNAEGERRYKVNIYKCPVYTEALETQAYNDNGEPDKTHDQDHPPDAGGYFIYKMFPLRHHTKKVKIVGK